MQSEIRTLREPDGAITSRRIRLRRTLKVATVLVVAASACGDGAESTEGSPGGGTPEARMNGMPAAPGNEASEDATPTVNQGPGGPPPQGAAGAGTSSNEAAMGAMVPLEPSTAPGDGNSGSAESEAPPPDETASEEGPSPSEPPATFNPCPTDGGPCQIMPLGDSITFGFVPNTGGTSNGGYRVELFRRALADGHLITFVGRVQNGPGTVEQQAFPMGNEGYSGITINGLAMTQVNAALGAAEPDIILLHIGTNDMIQPAAAAAAPSNLESLLDQISELEPDALLVVAQIIPLGFGGDAVSTYNATIPGIIQERIDAGKHLMLVDMFTPYAATNLGERLPDGVHPDVAGYALMAQTWYDAIEDLLP